MSNSFEDLKAQWRPGEIDDDTDVLAETLRRRQEVRRETDQQDARQEHEHHEQTFEREHEVTEGDIGHSGSSGGGSASGQQPVESSAPEAMPQRDDPDDGEHSVSSAEQEAEPVEIDATEKDQPADDADEAVDEEPSVPEGISDQDEVVEVEVQPVVGGAGRTERGTAVPRARRTGGASETGFVRGVAFSHGSEEVVLKRFPKELAERLRSLAATSLGEGFASEMSLTQLVAAFVVARLAEPFETDENTERAVAAFRDDDPRLAMIEDHTGELLSDVDSLRRDLSRMRDVLGEVSLTSETVQMGVSYLVVDRTIGMNTDGLTPSSIDVDQPKVLEATDNIRRRTKQQRAQRAVREGRRMS